MNWQIRAGTQNRKLGPGAYVVSLSSDTCPDDCPLKDGGCYAKNGHLRIHWNRLDRGESRGDGRSAWTGKGFKELAKTLERVVPHGALLRIGDVGDPSIDGRVPVTLVRTLGFLVRAKGVRPIIYTHAKPEGNERAAGIAKENGFALNFSGHGTAGATPGAGERVTTVAPEFWTDYAEKAIVRCPAETRPDVTCVSCGLCARPRGYAIGFTAHGSQSRRVAEVSQ